MLYKYEEITQMHLELTDKCNAGCSMCPRYINGGSKLNPNLALTEITLEQFKTWFDPAFVSQLRRVMACGNFGDPIMARDCLEIYQYLRQHNSTLDLGIHTNGSARSIKWWEELAKVLDMNHRGGGCVFSVDGLKDTNHLYRRGTNFDTILENMKAFIGAGGRAKWDFIAFQHNEYQIEEARELARTLGVVEFNIKKTTRWGEYDKDGVGRSPVRNSEGQITHYLQQPTQEEFRHKNTETLTQKLGQNTNLQRAQHFNVLPNAVGEEFISFPKKFNKEEYDKNQSAFNARHQLPSVQKFSKFEDIILNNPDYQHREYDATTDSYVRVDIRTIDIACRSQHINKGGSNTNNEIFISAHGYVFPCCFLGGEPWKAYALGPDGRSKDAFIPMLDLAGGLESISLHTHTLKDIISNNKLYTEYLTTSFSPNQNIRSHQCSLCCGKDWNILNNGELGNEKFFAKTGK